VIKRITDIQWIVLGCWDDFFFKIGEGLYTFDAIHAGDIIGEVEQQ